MYIKCDYCKNKYRTPPFRAWKRFFSDNHSLFDLHTISCIYFTTFQCVDFFLFFFFILIFGVLTPLSTIFQLYHSDQLQWWRKPEYPEITTDHGQATGKLYHLRVECTLFSSPGQRPCELLLSLGVRRPSVVRRKLSIFSSETTGPIATKRWWNGPWMTPSKIVSGDPDFQPIWPPS